MLSYERVGIVKESKPKSRLFGLLNWRLLEVYERVGENYPLEVMKCRIRGKHRIDVGETIRLKFNFWNRGSLKHFLLNEPEIMKTQSYDILDEDCRIKYSY